MLRVMIFACTAEAQGQMHESCLSLGDTQIFLAPDLRTPPADMVPMINSYSPELVLIEFEDREHALETEKIVHSSCPHRAILGFAGDWQHEALLKTSSGYTRVIPARLPGEHLRDLVQDVVHAALAPGPDNIIVFLPAKGGSGASTLALNVTGALANTCFKSAILIEADLHSGPAGMYLNFESQHSVVDVLEQSHRLDACWNDLITPVGNFGILPASNGEGPVSQPSSWAYRRLIQYTRQRYEYVIFDLPEVVDHATEAVVTSAKIVYVVCTPEVASLMLARRRCAGLIERGVPADRVRVLLNRHSRNSPEPAAIGEILGYPVGQVIPDDYKSLWEANIKRRLVDEKSIVGRAIESFAWTLTGRPAEPVTAGRKLLGLFTSA